jgi:hypothetical protein
MSKSKVVAGLAIALLLYPLILFAQTDEELERELNRKKFAGWEAIVFRCLPDNDGDDLQKQLCAAAAADARFLAASGKIPFRDLGDKNSLQVYLATRDLNNALIVETTMRATQGQPRAVYMRLRASEYYLNAVEKGAVEGSSDSKPRPGDLILWERSIIGAGGPEHEIRQVLSNAFSTVLKDFFGVFVESRN